MTTAKGYNAAVEDLAAAQGRVRELETRCGELKASAIYKRMLEREAQIIANEGQLDRWSFEIEPLKARNAELATRVAKLEAGLKDIAEHPHCQCCPHATTPYDRGLAEGHQADAQLALDALADVENDVTPTP